MRCHSIGLHNFHVVCEGSSTSTRQRSLAYHAAFLWHLFLSVYIPFLIHFGQILLYQPYWPSRLASHSADFLTNLMIEPNLPLDLVSVSSHSFGFLLPPDRWIIFQRFHACCSASAPLRHPYDLSKSSSDFMGLIMIMLFCFSRRLHPKDVLYTHSNLHYFFLWNHHVFQLLAEAKPGRPWFS